MTASTSAGSGVGRLVGAVTGAARGVAGSVGDVATKVAARGGGHGGAVHPQTVTVAAPAETVLAAWREADVLSRVLGDLGRVEAPTDGRYRWTFGSGDAERPWTSVLVQRDGGLRHEGDEHSIDVTVRPAPQQLGTEVRLVLDLPLPAAGPVAGLAAGAAAFTVLYRLRALLQTGEIPTLTPQPAARAAER